MARYIDADKLIDTINEWLDSVGVATVGKGLSYYGELIGCIEETETSDVQEVKHGRWDDTFDGITPYCTICGMSHRGFERTPPYCPHCGAKMDG